MRRHPVVGIGLRPGFVLAVASLGGLVMFMWPLVLQPPDGVAHRTDAPFLVVNAFQFGHGVHHLFSVKICDAAFVFRREFFDALFHGVHVALNIGIIHAFVKYR